MHLYGFLKMCTVLDISGELQQPGLPLPCSAAPAISCMWRMPTPLQVQLLCLSDPDPRLSGEGTRVRGNTYASDISAHNALLVRPDPYCTQAFSQPRLPLPPAPFIHQIFLRDLQSADTLITRLYHLLSYQHCTRMMILSGFCSGCSWAMIHLKSTFAHI